MEQVETKLAGQEKEIKRSGGTLIVKGQALGFLISLSDSNG